MKRVSQLTALALLMGLAASTTCAAETMPALTLSHLQQQHGVAIDTRLSAYYNGWPQRANGPEGHEPQALNLSARWLGAMSDDQLRAWAKQHQLQSDTPIALYGSPEDNVSVAARLKQTGFTRLSTLSDALSQTDRLQKLPHFEQLVYPQWLHDLQQGKAVAAAPAGDWKVFPGKCFCRLFTFTVAIDEIRCILPGQQGKLHQLFHYIQPETAGLTGATGHPPPC
ncbi:hypothetical protein NUBL12144_31450 [Klebsiella pneumoniae]|nr:hypothetical protein NUBL12144_31450 [Klebsiella pneumoniae]